MAQLTMKRIRRATEKNRAGFDLATDSQVLIIWNAVDDETRELYIKSITTGEVTAEPIGE